MLNRRVFCLAVAAAALAQTPSRAQQRGGGGMSRSQLRARVRSRYPGCEIVNDEIFRDREGRPVAYRAVVVTRDGRRLTVSVDPRTGRVS